MQKMVAMKSKKGLSGAVVALILVIAAVIIALVVVGFVFGLFGSFTGAGSVSQVGTGTINSNNGQITLTLKNTGSPVTVSSVVILGTLYSSVTSSPTTITQGTDTYTITINANLGTQLNNLKGSTLTISINLSNGQSVNAAVIVK